MKKNIIRLKNKILNKYNGIFRKKDIANLITGNGERYDPRLTIWEDYSHLKRYEFALQFINRNDSVLDIACGTGYGTKILGSKANIVYGVDISKKAISYAKKNYKLKNTKYIQQHFWDCNITVDIVVSFETLEHIPNENGIIDLFNKLLNLSGKIVIASVPYLEKVGNNPHHIHFNLNEESIVTDSSVHKMEFLYQRSDGQIDSDKKEDEVYQNLIIIASHEK
jgi:2-polyprenyl-3-methyl-5-hydroxy-6-metoxy-1,4-benzoquinol methylase